MAKNEFVLFVFHLSLPRLRLYGMNTIEDSNIELFDIDSENVRQKNPFSYLNQNGFLLCKRGRISLVMDERQYDMEEGDLYIYPAFTQTQVLRVSDDLQGVAGRADFNFILSSLDSLFDTQSHIYIRFHPLVSLTAEQLQRIEEIIGFVRRRNDIHTELGRHIVSSLVRAFCYEVIDAYIANKAMQPATQTRKDKTFQNFLVSLYQNFHIHREVQFYAREQNLTPRYFTTLIRKVSGKTPSQWITTFVIIEAKRLLSNPKISVKETSSRLHFTDQSFFGRYFKSYAGCSPSEYKNAAFR